MTPPVAFVHVLDHLLAAARLDIHVDVRRPVTRRGEEALEEQSQVDRVDVGDAERVADSGVGGRAPPLAIDVEAFAHLRDVPHDEEVAGEAEPADHVELMADLLPRPGHPLGLRCSVARRRALGHEPAQVALLVHSRGNGEVGQLRGDQSEVEGAGAPELGGALDDPRGQRAEAPGLLGRRAQASHGSRGQPALQLGQRAARPHRRQGGRQPKPGRRGVVHVVGRHGVDPPLDRQTGQRNGASLRAVSTGSPWSRSSSATLARPNASTSRPTSREAARGPASISAAGTAPFRQPLSTSQ